MVNLSIFNKTRNIKNVNYNSLIKQLYSKKKNSAKSFLLINILKIQRVRQ